MIVLRVSGGLPNAESGHDASTRFVAHVKLCEALDSAAASVSEYQESPNGFVKRHRIRTGLDSRKHFLQALDMLRVVLERLAQLLEYPIAMARTTSSDPGSRMRPAH